MPHNARPIHELKANLFRVLGHPALGVAWLANKLGAHGVALEPGHLVLAGSFTRVVFAQKGDTLHADFGALGGIAVQFV